MPASENIKGINIQIGGDTTPLYNALNEASMKTRELETDLENVNQNLKLNPQNLDALQKKFDILGKVVDSCANEVDILKEGLADAKMKFANGDITEEQFNEIADATEKAEEKLKYYQEQFDAFKEAEGNLINITKRMQEQEKEQEDLHRAWDQLHNDLTNADFEKNPDGWRKIKEAEQKAREEMEKHRQVMDETQRELNETKQKLDDASSGMQTYAEAQQKAGQGAGDFGEETQTAESKLNDFKKDIFEGGAGLKIMSEALNILKQGLQEALKALQEYASELYPVSQAFMDATNSDKEFLKGLKEQKSELKLSATQIDIQKKRILELNKSIQSSNKAHRDSKKDRIQLKVEVEKLNEALGEEVLHIDDSTGALKESNRVVEESLENYKRRALIQYELNAYVEAYARYQDGLAELENKNVYYSNIANNSYQQRKRAIEELGREFERHEARYNELMSEEAEWTDESETNYQQWSTSATEHLNAIIDKIKEYRDKNAEYQDNIYKKIQDTNKAINDASETSLEERLEILKKNGQAILNYESNLAYLRTLQMQTMNGDQKKALDEFIRMLSDGSEDSMQILNLVVKDFKEAGGNTAWEFISEFTRKDIPSSIYNVGTQTVRSFAQGMHDSQSSLMRVADQIASAIRDKFQKKFTIKAIHGGAGMYVTDMAQGGIVTEPTYIRAGELGAEAILPLDKLAGIITQTMNQTGGGVGTYTMNVYPQSMSDSEQEMLFAKFDRRFGASTSRRNI